jgi:hypothetical protein
MKNLIDNHQPKAQSIMPTSDRELRDEHCDFSSEAGIKMYFAYHSNKANAPVITKPTRGYTFIDVIIENQRFKGYVGYGGPLIVEGLSFGIRGCVPLGVAEIHFIDSFPDTNILRIYERKPGWWICNDGPDNACINITALSDEGRYTLAYQFGLPLYPRTNEQPDKDLPYGLKLPEYPSSHHADLLFYLSPSFSELCTWAQTHTRQIRSSEFLELFLPGWKNACIKREFVPLWSWWEQSIKAMSLATE